MAKELFQQKPERVHQPYLKAGLLLSGATIFLTGMGNSMDNYDNPTPIVRQSNEVFQLETAKPAPFSPPEINLIQSPIDGEGKWTYLGLPQSLDDPFMASAFVKPDTEKSFPLVKSLLLDHRRVKLNMVCGTVNGGTGKIPDEDLSKLLVTTTGGFQFIHGDWGMFADGTTYKDLKSGRASLTVGTDGSVNIGTWGDDGFSSTDGLTAVRQNGVILLKDGELTADALGQGDEYVWRWYVNGGGGLPDYYAWRAGIGLTANGDLMIANGSEVTARTLMLAMKAMGAVTAMQMDINSPFVHTVVVDHSDGQPIPKIFAGADTDQYVDLKTKQRDFMYLTRDDTIYK